MQFSPLLAIAIASAVAAQSPLAIVYSDSDSSGLSEPILAEGECVGIGSSGMAPEVGSIYVAPDVTCTTYFDPGCQDTNQVFSSTQSDIPGERDAQSILCQKKN
ncbi:hypothetical protein BO86DRAFT_376570 [Aspergillus japonicus CBS 114.51]|uniref:Uncharacterized protein n=2 Tax=Aspergillus TaxID=5052 RepID=A0A2V5HLX0_ASPV1|nr:hypothetical protein BO86DRAFT_376570 [Aspergillus japonicus CBS 114.51]PYI23562.1 hypothetical protein BO99DRAFT_409133 [Aspergillus violaceofuscus CBS 115571]RAH84953.1 hypothetical protein BO86DRAFT_376570 [Aspergillus japonicus CBS 114.51]